VEAANEIKDETQHQAENNAGDQRKMYDCMLAAISDVARKPAQWKPGAPGKD
jgi:hypothetical protein